MINCFQSLDELSLQATAGNRHAELAQSCIAELNLN